MTETIPIIQIAIIISTIVKPLVFFIEAIVAKIFFMSNAVIGLPNYSHNLYNEAHAGAISICGRN